MERFPANGANADIHTALDGTKDPERALRAVPPALRRRTRRRRGAPSVPLVAPGLDSQSFRSPGRARPSFLRRRVSFLVTGAPAAQPETEVGAAPTTEPQPTPLTSPMAPHAPSGVAEAAPAAAAPAESPRPVVSLKNERQCVRCRRWFWAWDTRRTACYFCEP